MVGFSDWGPREARVAVGRLGSGITRPRAITPSGQKVKSGGRNYGSVRLVDRARAERNVEIDTQVLLDILDWLAASISEMGESDRML